MGKNPKEFYIQVMEWFRKVKEEGRTFYNDIIENLYLTLLNDRKIEYNL